MATTTNDKATKATAAARPIDPELEALNKRLAEMQRAMREMKALKRAKTQGTRDARKGKRIASFVKWLEADEYRVAMFVKAAQSAKLFAVTAKVAAK